MNKVRPTWHWLLGLLIVICACAALFVLPRLAGGRLLISATRVDCPLAVKVFEAMGADVDAEADGWTALQVAARDGDAEAAEVLLRVGADPNQIMRDGETPLQRAAGRGHSRIVGHLLEYGADVEVTGRSGSSALRNAARAGSLETVKVVLEHMARKGEQSGEPSRVIQKHGPYALREAAARGYNDIIRLLMAYGVDLDPPPYWGGSRSAWHYSLLHSAIWGPDPMRMPNHKETVALLVEHGADVNATSEDGDTVLRSAAARGQVEVVRLLLANGARSCAPRREGSTPLHEAVQPYWAPHHSRELAAMLLAHGADVNARDGSGATPLHIAANGDAEGAVELLLSHGAEVNARDDHGQTPLHNATVFAPASVVEALLEHGADANATDSQGKTPLDIALRRYDEKDVTVRKGDWVVATSREATPAEKAASKDEKRIIEVLRQYGAEE